jgi:hypothetical protein
MQRGNQFGIIPINNNAVQVKDIRLTSKQIHEACIITTLVFISEPEDDASRSGHVHIAGS